MQWLRFFGWISLSFGFVMAADSAPAVTCYESIRALYAFEAQAFLREDGLRKSTKQLIKEIARDGFDVYSLHPDKNNSKRIDQFIESLGEVIVDEDAAHNNAQTFKSAFDWVNALEQYWNEIRDQDIGEYFFTLNTGVNPRGDSFEALKIKARRFGDWGPEMVLMPRAPHQPVWQLSYPPGYSHKNALEGIRGLWNDPQRVIELMRQFQSAVKSYQKKFSHLSDSEVIEKLRRDLEVQHGFLPAESFDKFFSSDVWHKEVLSQKIPSIEVHGLHSHDRLEGSARHVHRNQWVLIMLDMNERPERYPGFQNASDLYAAFAHPVAAEDDFDTSSLWWQLFDRDASRGPELSNFSNPFYFHDVWMKATGFETDQ